MGGAGAGAWAVVGRGRWGAAAVVARSVVVGVDSADSVDLASDSELASPAARVKSLEKGDHETGLFGSGNESEPPSRSTTTRMKSAQIEAGNVPPATATPCTLYIDLLVPSELG